MSRARRACFHYEIVQGAFRHPVLVNFPLTPPCHKAAWEPAISGDLAGYASAN